MPFTTVTAKPKPLRKKPRKPSEFRRIYGSKERVEFVKGLRCCACHDWPSENAHIETGGTGRKADYTKIVPLCGPNAMGYLGCHRWLHTMGRRGFESHFGICLEDKAAQTEHAWLEHTEATK